MCERHGKGSRRVTDIAFAADEELLALQGVESRVDAIPEELWGWRDRNYNEELHLLTLYYFAIKIKTRLFQLIDNLIIGGVGIMLFSIKANILK